MRGLKTAAVGAEEGRVYGYCGVCASVRGYRVLTEALMDIITVKVMPKSGIQWCRRSQITPNLKPQFNLI